MTADDFFFPEYRAAFTAMCELHLGGHPVSVETVASRLNAPGPDGKNLLASIGGQPTIAATLSGASPEELKFWVDETVKNRKRRDLQAAMDEIQRKLKDAPDPDKLRAEMEERLVHLSSPDSAEVTHVSESAAALEQRIQRYIIDPESITGLQTGWVAWDKTLDGLRSGGVSIVYAKSSRYKSLFVQNMGLLFAMNGAAGLWYTTEMPVVDVQERLLQIHSGLNLRRLRQGGQIHAHAETISASMNAVNAMPIYMSEGFDVTTSSLRAEIKRQKRWNNIDYVIIDLVDHVTAKKYQNDIITQQSYIMRSLKDIAKKESVHIIAISHVAKGDRMDVRNVELPYEDMKGSSSKYQDVDVAICIVPVTYGIPPEKRGRQTEDHWYGLEREEIMQSISTTGTLDVMVTITKNRAGDTGRFRFALDFNAGGRFSLVS